MAVCILHRRSLRQLPQSLSEIADAEEDAPLSKDTIEVPSVMIVTPLRVLFHFLLHLRFPLQEFHACFNFLAHVPDHFFLPAANSLTRLFLCCNNLTAIPSLNTPHLTEFGLANNKIAKMEHLDCLPHLVHLDLRANRIHRLEGLSTNTRLCRLVLHSLCSHMYVHQ